MVTPSGLKSRVFGVLFMSGPVCGGQAETATHLATGKSGGEIPRLRKPTPSQSEGGRKSVGLLRSE